MSKFKRMNAPLCACGCGEFVKWNKVHKRWNKFISGHNARIDPPMRRPAIIAKRSGENHHYYNKKRIEMMGENNPAKRPEVRKKISAALSGKQTVKNKAHLKRLADIKRGKKCPKHSEFMKGKQYKKGHKGTEEFCKMRAEVQATKYGPLAPNWQGGVATEPYCDVWADKEYKESIKERDGRECQNPDCWCNCNHLSLTIHHIDYIKKNCGPDNLITVCVGCNSRANFNKEWWQNLYQNIMTEKYNYQYKEAA